MAIKRPKGARPDRKPRRDIGIKCGFKLPSTYPTGVPYIVTRYLSEQGSQAYKEDEEKGAIVQPCRIIGSQENGSTYDFHVEIEPHEEHQRRRAEAHDPDTDPQVMAFAPWTFKIGRRDKKTIEAFRALNTPVTVIRLPEVEVARPMPEGLPYGINPKHISIRLAMNELSAAERESVFQEKGFYPDFNCFTEHFQVWDNRANAPFCRGDAEWADRRNSETGTLDRVRCMPWTTDEDGTPNPHVCQFRGKWEGTRFVKPKNPCAEAIQFAFRVAGVPTLWIYQVFTKSPTTAGNIRPMLASALEFKPEGDVMGFPMVLSVEWKTFTPKIDGKEIKTEKPVWKLDVDGRVLTSLDRGSVNLFLSGGGGAKQLAAPAQMVDMAAAGEDLSEFYPDPEPDEEPPAQEDPWVDAMFKNEAAIGMFRQLGYTRGKGREVLEAYEKRCGNKPRAAMVIDFLAKLSAHVEKQAADSKKKQEQSSQETRREPEAPRQEVIDQHGASVDEVGADSLPDEDDFI